MLAGCSSTLLSPRHKLRIGGVSPQLQSCHFQLQEKPIGAQRLDPPCGFSSRKDPLRVVLSVEKPAADPRGRSSHPSPSSIVAHAPSWGVTDEASSGAWEKRRNSKRLHNRGSCDDDHYRAKRARTADIEGEAWLPQPIQDPPFGEEEEKVFLVPGAASFPLPTSSGHTLVPEFTRPENNDSDTGAEPNNPLQSDSSSSSGALSSSPEPTKDSSGNVNSSVVEGDGESSSQMEQQQQQQGLELVSLLTSCVESISSGNYEAMNFFLARLGDSATPLGSPIHRLVAYYTEALAFRVAKLRQHIFSVAPPKTLLDPAEDDDAVALRVLNCVTPILQFIHFTLNERLLQAFEGKDRVHIIDLDIKQGLQWPSLLQSLASRPNPPSHVKITGVGESRKDLRDAGSALTRLAESLCLPFEFYSVVDRMEDVRLWMLQVKREECVAVNCVLAMHKTLSDESGKASMDLLSLIRSTNPDILVMAEQEADHNAPNWEARLARSLGYYASLFDSMAHVLPEESHARMKVEQVFAKEIRNIVACDGILRSERHQSFDSWRRRMEEGGAFRCLGISSGWINLCTPFLHGLLQMLQVVPQLSQIWSFMDEFVPSLLQNSEDRYTYILLYLQKTGILLFFSLLRELAYTSSEVVVD